MIPVQKHMRAQAGFTLVELAIVMIIIGLLIAGVLKGQALIQNAQVTSTVAQVKAIEAATSTFVDTYQSLPGDLVNPATRLPACANACIVGAGATNGNGRLTNTPGATPLGVENEAFFPQLSAAGLVTGLTGGAAGSTTVNGNFPATKIANNVIMAGSAFNNVVGDFSAALLGAGVPEQGLYLTINNSIAQPTAATVGLKPDQAGRIDTKIDDGVPDTGLVRAFGAAGIVANAVNCGSVSAGAVPGAYATDTAAASCGLHIHAQN
jgi:prepilin-type N-terminal cleavage/methylation domain-containing protein